MGNKNGDSARKRSARIAKQSARESATPQPVSPEPQVIGSDPLDATGSVDSDNAGTGDATLAADPSDGHSSDITPPPEYVKPKTKSSPKRRAPSAVTLSGDSDADEPPPKKAKKTTAVVIENLSKRSACCTNLHLLVLISRASIRTLTSHSSGC